MDQGQIEARNQALDEILPKRVPWPVRAGRRVLTCATLMSVDRLATLCSASGKIAEMNAR